MLRAVTRAVTRTVHVRSDLAAPVDAVWAEVSTMRGVNRELAPWVRMSTPGGRAVSLEALPRGELAFHSWLLLGGVLPFDRHALVLARVDPGRGFDERSRSWLQRRWDHRRTLSPIEGGCRVEDEVVFEPRLLPGMTRRIVGRLFAGRHRALRRRFGTLS
ncbi:MAG: hypothetical protein CMN29_18480 [Sandaracinus sp.]|nr:hypothetical protein [Sandaracinus sp.]